MSREYFFFIWVELVFFEEVLCFRSDISLIVVLRFEGFYIRFLENKDGLFRDVILFKIIKLDKFIFK